MEPTSRKRRIIEGSSVSPSIIKRKTIHSVPNVLIGLFCEFVGFHDAANMANTCVNWRRVEAAVRYKRIARPDASSRAPRVINRTLIDVKELYLDGYPDQRVLTRCPNLRTLFWRSGSIRGVDDISVTYPHVLEIISYGIESYVEGSRLITLDGHSVAININAQKMELRDSINKIGTVFTDSGLLTGSCIVLWLFELHKNIYPWDANDIFDSDEATNQFGRLFPRLGDLYLGLGRLRDPGDEFTRAQRIFKNTNIRVYTTAIHGRLVPPSTITGDLRFSVCLPSTLSDGEWPHLRFEVDESETRPSLFLPNVNDCLFVQS